MSQKYFKNFPKVTYKLSNGKWVTIKDFFRKSTIEQKAINAIIDYQYYEIQDGERPDIIAHKLYGSSDLHWTLLLVNEIENYTKWYKDNQTFELYMSEKYPGQYLTGALNSDIITQTNKWLIGEKLNSSQGQEGRVLQVDPTYKRIGVSDGTWAPGQVVTGLVSNKSMTINSVQQMTDGVAYYKDSEGYRKNYEDTGFNPVTFYDMELEENEDKRRIKFIKPSIITQVVREFEKVMMN